MPDVPRQHIERVPGSRRARLTPVAGSDPTPEAAPEREVLAIPPATRGPNDERLLGDVPPHY